MDDRTDKRELKSKGSRSKHVESNTQHESSSAIHSQPDLELCPPNEFVNGMIFVCDERTTVDMFRHQIFGLPLPYLREMKLLVPHRSALFLIEKQTALIRGIFVPTSGAKKCINEKIWSRNNACSFPAQIKFKLHSSYPALPKNCDLSPNFLRRMKIKGKFLDKHRVDNLIKSLERYQEQQKSIFNPMYSMSPVNMFSPPPAYPRMLPPLNLRDQYDREHDYGDFSSKGRGYPSPTMEPNGNFGVSLLEQNRQNLHGMGMMAPISPTMTMSLHQAASNDFLMRNMMHNTVSGPDSYMGSMDKFDDGSSHMMTNELGTHV